MTRRTRSRGVKELKAQDLIRSDRANVTGLLAIPTEILLDIVSNFTSIPIPYAYGGRGEHGTPVEFLERSRALDALSQTCRRLRSVFFPVMWQKIEVGVEKQGKEDHTIGKRLATELLRKLEVVTVGDPTLALHVREVNVFISGYSQWTILPQFVRALCMFTNMTKLQIVEMAGHNGEEIAEAFRGQSFPSVELLVLPSRARASIECFPNVQHIYSTNENVFLLAYQWRKLTRLCPKSVVAISGFTIWAREIFEMVATHLPHLRDVQISGPALLCGGLGDSESVLKVLRQMCDLEVLRIWYPLRDLFTDSWILVPYAKRILATMQALQRDGDMKKIVIKAGAEPDHTGLQVLFDVVIDKDDDSSLTVVI